MRRRKHNASTLGVHRNKALAWSILPILQIGGNNLLGVHGLARRSDPNLQALVLAVIVGLVCLEPSLPNPRRQIQLFGNMLRLRFGLRTIVERRIVTYDAEGVAVRAFVQTSRGSLRHRIGTQPPDE